MPRYEYIYEIVKDADGVDCFVKHGEVVRCRDCKHWGIHKWLNIPWCREMHIDRGAEDFCSMAERKE